MSFYCCNILKNTIYSLNLICIFSPVSPISLNAENRVFLKKDYLFKVNNLTLKPFLNYFLTISKRIMSLPITVLEKNGFIGCT